MKDIIKQTKTNFIEFLQMANKKGDSEVSVFKLFKVYLLRERAIYVHLNMLKQSSMVFQGLLWCPKALKFD